MQWLCINYSVKLHENGGVILDGHQVSSYRVGVGAKLYLDLSHSIEKTYESVERTQGERTKPVDLDKQESFRQDTSSGNYRYGRIRISCS